ncbi:MAG: DUF5329 family protein [Bacteroidota bacterium]|nr:DUF5329 family protein [Bacteroidota bacterium]
MKNYIILLSFIMLLSCKNDTQIEAVPIPHGLKIPPRGIDITLVQRHSIDIVGYGSNLHVKIDEITAKQTIITLQDSQIILQQSIHEGDTFAFEFGGVGYIIECKKLINHLLDEDNGIFTITRDSLNKKVAVLSEKEKIEKLLYTIAHSNFIFIRNGDEHKSADAASHLRSKWDYAKNDIHTVNDFIEKIGSKSSSSGKSYQIKLPNGSIVGAEKWMRELVEGMK